jgi:hypothetical protein
MFSKPALGEHLSPLCQTEWVTLISTNHLHRYIDSIDHPGVPRSAYTNPPPTDSSLPPQEAERAYQLARVRCAVDGYEAALAAPPSALHGFLPRCLLGRLGGDPAPTPEVAVDVGRVGDVAKHVVAELPDALFEEVMGLLR